MIPDSSSENYPNLRYQHDKVQVNEDAPSFTMSMNDYATYSNLGLLQPITPDLIQAMAIRVLKNEQFDLLFDVANVDLSIVNAIRRIIIAEIPTVAIETVFMKNNTSVMPDEVLSHRIGLVPLKVNPDLLEYRNPGDPVTPENTLAFTMHVQCTNKPGVDQDLTDKLKYNNSHVYSRDIKWVPQGQQQEEKFAHSPPVPVHDMILLLQMRPNQVVSMDMHAVKGIGKTHAKFSPVATASYRLLPEINLVRPILGRTAELLRAACPLNVFDIEDGPEAKRCVVARPRNCSMCRECIRSGNGSWKDQLPEKDREEVNKSIVLTRAKDYVIFSVESTGILDSSTLVLQAFDIFLQKIKQLNAALSV
ncbi:putative DNA-directed RNA polymerases I and III subunit RPAC1 [Blattamonas nauphoetae]|uniref:DNA-directed RNA polymerases I and III subunit RPAC1 n=1 Tax=Blattamonas nauphoetae TaxID=2049346 RepID=A0ABQ9XQK3_9EUKA|nr:putative DNA-directed RNA polymerases I and III subunit RPAC1 [Blattamonas nauphoetae]